MRGLRRRVTTAVGVLVIALVAASCGSTGTANARRTNPVPKIGVVLSLTGTDAPIGIAQRMAIELAARQSGHDKGARFQPIFVNEASGPAGVAGLLARGVAAIVGPTHSSFAALDYSEVDIAQTPMLGISLSVPGLTAFRPYLWRVSIASDRTIPPAVTAAARATGATTAYIIYASNALFTVAEDEIFAASLAQDAVNVIGSSSFLSGQTNLSTIISSVKAAAPGLICVAAESTDAVRILQQLRAAGLNQAIVGGDGFNSSAVLSHPGAATDNVYVGSAWDANDPSRMSQTFVSDYRRAYGSTPDSFAAQAYAGIQVLRDAMRIGGATRAGIETGLGEINQVPTVLGPFSFDISRDAIYAPVINKIVNGKIFRISQ